jgi:predicted lipoprotein with Yx(FWY)xxD motif
VKTITQSDALDPPRRTGIAATAKKHKLEGGLLALAVLLGAIALVLLTAHSSPPSTQAIATPRAGALKATSPSVPATSNSNAKHISTTTIAGLGTVLVSGDGATLYTYAPDHDKRVTCVRTCAAIFPPVTLARDVNPVAAGSVHQSLLGSEPDATGGRVVTYAGWPLYTYISHSSPGIAPGQGLNINGGFLPVGSAPTAGLWHVIAPSGKVIANKR